MRARLLSGALVFGTGLGLAGAQASGNGIPAPVLTAKTITVINDTHDAGVEKGADQALASWGQFKLVDDPQLADITLHFDKSKEHEGSSSQATDPNTGKPSYSYGMSFSSEIHMKAFYKDQDTPFFSTHTDDSKTKAGMECVNDLHTAYREAIQQSRR